MGDGGREALAALLQDPRLNVRTVATAFLPRYKTAEAPCPRARERRQESRSLAAREGVTCSRNSAYAALPSGSSTSPR